MNQRRQGLAPSKQGKQIRTVAKLMLEPLPPTKVRNSDHIIGYNLVGSEIQNSPD